MLPLSGEDMPIASITVRRQPLVCHGSCPCQLMPKDA
jgi:hypothetical protein